MNITKCINQKGNIKITFPESWGQDVLSSPELRCRPAPRCASVISFATFVVMFASFRFFLFAALWWQFYTSNKGNGSDRVRWNEEVWVQRETESSSCSNCCPLTNTRWCLESGSEPKYLLTPGGMLFSVIAILSSKSLFANMNLFCIKSIMKAAEVQ